MSRIHVADELARLKDFQRSTVDHVFRRMYLDADCTDRFLVADEVGLGKTMVARGVVARAVAHLKSKVQRVDVVYVCSNAAIAAQNIQRLNVLPDQEVAFATRLTLLPARVHELAQNRVNFVSFTPAVALDVKSRGGTKEERVILHSLLAEWDAASNTALRNLLQATASRNGWQRALDDAPRNLDETLSMRFLEGLRANRALTERLSACLDRFKRYRDDVPREDNDERLAVIGELRHVLARTCIDALEPDLVVLDEFQRFSEIMHGDDETAELARLLFDYKDVRVLLLSATPYKMLTLAGEEGDDHFRDFLATTKFLLRSETKAKELDGALRELRSALRSASPESHARARAARDAAERILRSVMTRMERVANTADRDAQVVEPAVPVDVVREDISQAMLAEQVSRVLSAGDAVEYWKSAPYLLSFMRDYELATRLRDAPRKEAREVAAVLGRSAASLLRKEDIERYAPVPLANGRLRALARDTLDRGLWKLLWLPPSLRYVAPHGPWEEVGDATKALVFSSWNVVPDAIAGLLSYEAERRMVGENPTRGYQDERRALLTFRLVQRRPGGMTTLLLHYPCALLAEHCDPLKILLDRGHDGPIPLEDLRSAVRAKIDRLLKPLPQRADEPADARWYWAAPVLLDRRYPGVEGWRRGDFSAIYDEDEVDDGDGVDTGFEAHVAELHRLADGELTLGSFPEDLADILVDVALGSPAVCAARALRRLTNLAADEPALLGAAARVARGFRTLFNVPETMALLRSQSDDHDVYWREVLRHCAEGDLQAVLDEYAHYLRDDLGLATADDEARVEGVASAMTEALSLRTTTVLAYDVRADGERVSIDDVRIRSRFAVRFGAMKEESDNSVKRADVVRRAFNSPFRPFVLASTSVGQEGLDFHPYCHAIVHWNLPPNPVDIEQREGRVHRYKGHAIRRNVARAYGLSALAQRWTDGDPWERMFELAKADRPATKNDLWPYWLFETDGGVKVERRVPMLPLSREHEQLRRLKKSLAVYRLTFGQPRQEDLLSWLEAQRERGQLDASHVAELGIRLAPPTDLLPPNEDPDPETPAELEAPPTPRMVTEGADATIVDFAGSEDAARAVARLFVATLDAIPNAPASVHWTLNRRGHCLRLNLGLPEVLTLYNDNTLTAGIEGLSVEQIALLREAGADIRGLPYAQLRRLAPRARWLTIDASLVAPHYDVITAGVTALVQLDTRTSRAHTRQYLAEDVVRAMGRIADDARWAAWSAPAS